MLRKIVIVFFALAAVVGGAVAPTTASARGFRGGRGGGFYRGGYGRGYGRGYGFGVLPFVAAAPYYYGGGGCYRTVRVYTPYGPRLRRTWVC